METVAETAAAVQNVPALRFPKFEGEWEQKRFGDVTKRISDPVKVEEDKQYQQIGIRSHGKGLFHKEFVDGKSLGNKRVFWVKEDTFIVNIVFAWEQAIGKTTKAENGMIASHRFPMYLPIKNQSNLDYLVYFFLTKRGKFLLELASPGGAGRNKTLGQKEFENLKFLIPSLPEQQKIASFLTAADEKIQQLSKKKELLEKYKKGVMQQIFSQQIRFKDDNGNDFPEWEEKRLGEIASSISNGVSIDQNQAQVGYKVTRIETISSGEIDLSRVGYIDTQQDISKYKLAVGDLLFSNINSVTHIGKIAFVYADFDLYHGMNLLRISIDRNQHYPLFHYYQLTSKKLKQHFERVCNQAVSQASINQTDLKKTKLFVPALPEQVKIANFLTSIDKKINYTSKQLEQAQQFKKGLLQQMFV